jgi:hypothetical protein
MLVILAAQEAEIRNTVVWNQPGRIVGTILSQKNPTQKRAGGVVQGGGPELKPQYSKKMPNGFSLFAAHSGSHEFIILGYLHSHLQRK